MTTPNNKAHVRENKNGGGALEDLVATIEAQLLPHEGFSITQNKKIFDEDGHQLAEFDVVISGVIGSCAFSWLIECRDRPGCGASPRSWIEQLRGRKEAEKFNHIVAVSTTGFSPSATALAEQFGIELKVVNSIEPDVFIDIIGSVKLPIFQPRGTIRQVRINFDPHAKKPQHAAACRILSQNSRSDDAVFFSPKHGVNQSCNSLLHHAISTNSAEKSVWNDVAADSLPKKIVIEVDFFEDDYPVIRTDSGDVKILAMIFLCEVYVACTYVEPIRAVEYKNHGAATPISQSVFFAPFSLSSTEAAHIEIHNFPDKKVAHVKIRIGTPKDTHGAPGGT